MEDAGALAPPTASLGLLRGGEEPRLEAELRQAIEGQSPEGLERVLRRLQNRDRRVSSPIVAPDRDLSDFQVPEDRLGDDLETKEEVVGCVRKRDGLA